MKYDFTSIIDRRGRDAIAVDGLKGDGFSPAPPKEGFDAIPMWVADMNFPTVPTIQEAIIERAKHPAFGYFQAPAEYFDSIIRWHETRNGVTGLKPEHIGYENGVLGGVISPPPPSRGARMPGCGRRRSMPPPRPSIWRALWAVTTSCTTTGGGIAS